MGRLSIRVMIKPKSLPLTPLCLKSLCSASVLHGPTSTDMQFCKLHRRPPVFTQTANLQSKLHSVIMYLRIKGIRSSGLAEIFTLDSLPDIRAGERTEGDPDLDPLVAT